MIGERNPTASADGVDVLIVGAGPAGLFAALGVSRASDCTVLLIDAGLDVDERRLSGGISGCSPSLVEGVGGAGLFSDGKLCLSLRVGGNLPSLLDQPHRQRLLDAVACMLEVEGDVVEPAHHELPESLPSPGKLEFTYYPVLHIGTDHCADRIAAIRDVIVEAGVRVQSATRLVDLTCNSGEFTALLSSGGSERQVRAASVVLAMGKVGAHEEARICTALGATVTEQPMYVGVRVDTEISRARGLFQGSDDPKYKLHFPDGTKVKTHCVAEGGEILPLVYEGLPLAGGHAYRGRQSGRTSFGVLWDGIRDEPDAYGIARRIMTATAQRTDGRLLAQRLVDYRQGRASTEVEVACARPSAREWAAGDVREVLPNDYFPKFEAFLDALAARVPDLWHPSTVLFAPAIEWWMSRVDTDARLQTSVPGLYVAGDGAGWSQGIVHAAATGLLVAEGISGVPMNVRQLPGLLLTGG